MRVHTPKPLILSVQLLSIFSSVLPLTLCFTLCVSGCDNGDRDDQESMNTEQDASLASSEERPPEERPTLEEGVVGVATDDFFPEGITRSSSGDLYMGSLNTGSIVVVRQGERWAQEWINGDRFEGAGTAGLIADSARGVLWACTGDFFGRIPSKVWKFDLMTGETQAQFQLPERGFCNDLALDDQGRVYATDSFGGRILRVDDQGLTVWLEGEEYQPVNNSPLSLNGIAWDPQGKLWLGRSDTGQLSSVVIRPDGTPGDVQLNQLNLPEDQEVLGIDGLKWRSDKELIAIRGRVVSQLINRASESEPNWEINQVDDTLNHATTFTFNESKSAAWVVESQLARFYQSLEPDFPFQASLVELPEITASTDAP